MGGAAGTRRPPEITRLTAPGGRLHAARAAVDAAVAGSDFLQLVRPRGALYAFPSVDPQRLPGFDDEAFALELLEREAIALVPGSSFNIAQRNHFRVTLLPPPEILAHAFARIERLLAEHACERRVAWPAGSAAVSRQVLQGSRIRMANPEPT